MLMSKLVGERVKENPSDVQIKSHALMMRGGYMKQVANGIYSFLPPTQKISQKIQNIIREEMDAIDGQEVLFP
ncbi:MAG: proline--tRNA ligase, partial [Clostridia bacterium]|nr:proline--tRNA ligase [Clostridia bacterium]